MTSNWLKTENKEFEILYAVYMLLHVTMYTPVECFGLMGPLVQAINKALLAVTNPDVSSIVLNYVHSFIHVQHWIEFVRNE